MIVLTYNKQDVPRSRRFDLSQVTDGGKLVSSLTSLRKYRSSHRKQLTQRKSLLCYLDIVQIRLMVVAVAKGIKEHPTNRKPRSLLLPLLILRASHVSRKIRYVERNRAEHRNRLVMSTPQTRQTLHWEYRIGTTSSLRCYGKNLDISDLIINGPWMPKMLHSLDLISDLVEIRQYLKEINGCIVSAAIITKQPVVTANLFVH